MSYEPDAATYWRRRFGALVVGLTIVATIVWAVCGVLGAGGTGGAASGSRAAAGRGEHLEAAGTTEPTPGTGGAPGIGSRPGGGSGSGSGPDGAAASGPGASVSGASSEPRSTSGASSALGAGTAPGAGTFTPGLAPYASAPGAGPLPAPAAAGGAGRRGLAESSGPGARRACRPADVVLSLFASQHSYGRGQRPEFAVDVVSTAARTCAFNVGHRFLALVITSGGKRVWNSATCAARPRSLVTDLARGVPAILPITWGLRASAPGSAGCAGPDRAAQPGSYTASASDDGIASNPVFFETG